MKTATKNHYTPRGYGSGTTNVEPDRVSEPNLYVVIVNPVSEDEGQRDRFRICEELAGFLNGELSRPAWLDDMSRPDEFHMVHMDGLHIEATGPVYDSDPPNLFWKTRNDEKSRNKRARLIDRLWLK